MMEQYILVTGATKGLGFEIAKQLSENGYNIILVSHNQDNLLKAKSFLNQSLQHKLVKFDFEKDNIEILFEQIKELKIVSIIHNFGMNFSNDIHPIDIDIFEKTIYSNFTLSLKINNYLYKTLDGDPSKIIYIGSTASLHAKASPSYTLSKSLINTYVKNVSKFYLDYNILICVVLPGILDHEGSVWYKKKESNQEYYNSVKNEQPLKRFAKPKDIAPYVIDIVHQKSLLLTGSIVKLDANSY